MAQISDGALRKVSTLTWAIVLTIQVLAEIEARAVSSAQSLQQVNAQISASEREKRMLQLTQTELSSYSPDTPVYTGVGKMYVINER